MTDTKPQNETPAPDGSGSKLTQLLAGRILPCGTYTKVGDEMTWPSYDQGDLEWLLRYGSDESMIKKRMLLASIVSAYRELIGKTQKQRNQICRAIREAS